MLHIHSFLLTLVTVRLFRQLTAAHLFVEDVGPNGPTFTLTALGRPYLHPDHRAFNNFMFFDLIPSIMAMPKTLAEKGYKAATKSTGTPFEWANGEELWTWIGARPNRAANMVAAMTSHNALNAYPWGAELAKLGLEDQDVAVVDVAGGQGHISKLSFRVPHLYRSMLVTSTTMANCIAMSAQTGRIY